MLPISHLKCFQMYILAYCSAVIRDCYVVSCGKACIMFIGLEWHSAIVGGFLPFEQQRIPEPLCSVFSGHVAPVSEVFASLYCLDSPVFKRPSSQQ